MWNQVSPIALGALQWKFNFVFIAFNICVTFPTILFVFKETKKLSLEEIDLLFGERALGTLPSELEEIKRIDSTSKHEDTAVAAEQRA